LNNAGALKVYEQALTTTENNVTNANTPGYVRQSVSFEAEPFDLSVGLPGGVTTGPMQSSRDAFAEQAVRDQQSGNGYYQQKMADLTPVETYFDLSSTSGLAPAISKLFQSFSQLSVSPNDRISRQGVLDSASAVAVNFNRTANGLLSEASNIGRRARGAIDDINHLASLIADVNKQGRVDAEGSVNAGVDAQLNSDLEQLSQLVNFKALQQPDGTVTVYIDGQTPLVVGGQVFALQGDFSTQQAKVLSSTGSDITAQITSGRLSALLDDQNSTLPAYLSDLNTLARSLADQVNATLENGIDQNGAAPALDLFHYDAGMGAALTLAVNPLTTDQIAAALPGASGGNGNAVNLAALADARVTDGYTFAQFYGNLGGHVGNDLDSAKNSGASKQALLSQAQALREQVSGVSLDEEAEHLMQYQRSYQAISKMLGVLNSLTDTLMNLIH
jgi:flagellar hook-associated protein 1 FlgK